MRMLKDIQVFSKEWFEYHQARLLWLANTKWGRDLLGITEGEIRPLKDERIVKITPNSIHTNIGEDRYIGACNMKNKYAINIASRLKWVWKAMHWFDMNIANPLVPQMNLGFDTFTGSPGSNSGNGTSDAFLRLSGLSPDTWANFRAATTANSINDYSSVILWALSTGSTSGEWDDISRSGLSIDTSSIDAGATINLSVDSKLDLVAGAKSNNFAVNTFACAMCDFSPADNDSFAVGDFDTFGSTLWSTEVDYDDIAGTFTHTLVAAGVNGMNPGGITTFGWAESNYDIVNVEPTWASGDSVIGRAHSGDTGDAPVLSLDYTLSTGKRKIIVNHIS